MAEDVKEAAKKPSHFWRNCIFVGIGLVALGVLVIVFIFIYANFINNPYLGSKTANKSSNSTTTTASTASSGNWTLKMTSPFSITGPLTSLTGQGQSTINIAIKGTEGEKFSGSGPWSSEAHGSVGASTETTNLSGTMTINGQISNGKLTFLPAFNETSCRTEVVTPIGSQVTTTCDANSIPDQKTITIALTDGATATADVATNFGEYSYDWKENWTITKSK